MDIDDDLSHLDADLEIQCWSSTHRAYAFGVGLPVLIIWGNFRYYLIKRFGGSYSFICKIVDE